MKFSNKLSLTIFTAGLIVLIILSFAIYKFNYNSVVVSQTRFTESIAMEISDDIDHLLSEKIKTALTLANCDTIVQALEKNTASYTNFSDEKREDLIKQLNEKWKSTKNPADNFILEFTDNKAAQFLKKQQILLKDEYGEIFLTNKFGALVASTSKLSTFAHGHKYWWQGAYNKGEGAVFFDDRGYDESAGGYVLGLVVPVKKNNQIIGVLKCNLNILGSISELISGAQDKLIGEFKLIRSGGMIVFEEGREPLSTQIHDKIFKQLKNKTLGSIIVNDSKEEYLVAFSQIKLTSGKKGQGFGGTFESIGHKKGNKGESWYALCYRQMDVIQTPVIESTKSIVFIGFAIITILLMISYLFGKKIAQPLATLNKATQKIGKGDFEHTIEILQDDEFGNLASAFNEMAVRLNSTTTSITHLQNSEKLLKQSDDQFQKLLNSINDIVWSADLDGKIFFINPAVKNIYGRKASDFIKDSAIWMEAAHPEDHDKVLESSKQLFDKGIVESQYRIVRPDGEIRWLNDRKSLVYDPDGNPVQMGGIASDITKEKIMFDEKTRIMSELKERFKELDCLYKISNSIRLRKTLDHIFEDVVLFIPLGWQYPESTCCRISFENREYISKNFIETPWKMTSDIIISNQKKGSIEIFYLKEFPLLDEGPFLKDERNLLNGISHALTEACEHHIAQKKVALFSHFFENSLNEIYMFEADTFRFTQVNNAAQHNLGYTMEELLTMTPLNLKPEYSHKSFSKLVTPLSKGEKKKIIFETVHKRKDKSLYNVEIHLQLLNHDSKLLFAAIVLDITEQIKLEKDRKILQAETMRAGHLASIGELAAGVAHEINNPVTGIISIAEIMTDKFDELGGDRDIPERIINEGERISGIVKNLLSFARDKKEEHSPGHINDIIRLTLDLMEKQLFSDGIHLSVNIASDIPKLKMRTQEIQQVFLNLISNARYALKEKYPDPHENKTLEITGKIIQIKEIKYVRLTFHDNGMGIDVKLHNKITNPFFSTKPQGEGTGLGLSISHGIIKNHGGTLWFESIKNEYTKAHIDLPINNGWAIKEEI